MKNRLLSGLLATTMLFSMLPSTVFATGEITTSGGTNDVPAKVTQDATTFSVTVPTSLPVHVDSDGTVTVATDNKIINNSYGPVEVKSIEVQSKNDWTLVDFSTNFSTKKVGLKQFGFQINDANVLTDGSCEAEFAVIAGNSQLGFTYDAVVAMQKAALSDEQIASVVFTVGWADSAAEETGPSGYEITPVSELDTYEDTDGNVSLVLDNGESADLSAVATYSTETPTWSSSNPSVVSISDEGVMTAVAPGYAEITYGTSRVSETIGVWVPETFELTNSDYDLIDYTEGNTELVIPKYVMNDTQLKKITSIAANTFTNHNNITSIELPESIINIGDNAFDGCTSIENVDYQGSTEQWEKINIGNNNNDLVNKSDFAVALTGISLNKTSFTLNAGMNSTLTVTYNPSNTTENKTVVWSSSDESIATIDSNGNVTAISEGIATITATVGSCSNTCKLTVTPAAGYYDADGVMLCSWEESGISDNLSNLDMKLPNNATKLVIPEGITTLYERALRSPNSLTTIVIPSSLTTIPDNAFKIDLGVPGTVLNTITVVDDNPNYCSENGVFFNKDKTKLIFYPRGKSETTYTIPDGVTSIGGGAFDYEKDLSNIEIPDSVVNIGPSAFSCCMGLTSIDIPDGVTSIGNGAFTGCEKLTSIVIPDNVTYIGERAFWGCKNLTSINIPDGVTSIGEDTFYDCESLTSIEIPDSVTSIGKKAFRNCRQLTSIDIPDSVTSIGTEAFYYCTKLTTVNYTGTQEQWNAISIGTNNTKLTSATINYNYKG